MIPNISTIGASVGKEKTVLYSEIAGAVTDIILNAILIPIYASAGAAVGTLVAETVVLIVQYCYLRKYANGLFGEVRYHTLLIALAVGTVASLWPRMLHQGYFITLVISAVCFFGVYGSILLIMREPMLSYVL